MRKKIIFVGGYPPSEKNQHPGGQLTASRLLVKYANNHDIDLKIIDTTQSSFPVPSFLKRLRAALLRLKKLVSYLIREKVDGIVIFSSAGFSFYEKILMVLFTNIFRVKSLFFIRSGHFIVSSKNQKILKSINNILLKLPTYIGAQGNNWVKFYSELGVKKSKIKLIHNWIQVKDNTRYITNDEKVVFLFVGWIVEKKGVLDLFDTIQNSNELNKYSFRFVGQGTLFEDLKSRIQHENIKNIELVGWKHKSELKQEYENADVFILPSYAEGFPNVIAEALNFKLPIISTNVGGISDSVIDNYNGFLIEPKDKHALRESIKKMGASKELRQEFSKHSAKLLINNHDFNYNCEKVFELF